MIKSPHQLNQVCDQSPRILLPEQQRAMIIHTKAATTPISCIAQCYAPCSLHKPIRFYHVCVLTAHAAHVMHTLRTRNHVPTISARTRKQTSTVRAAMSAAHRAHPRVIAEGSGFHHSPLLHCAPLHFNNIHRFATASLGSGNRARGNFCADCNKTQPQLTDTGLTAS